MNAIKLIIFDFDGVLCPLNFPIIFETYRHMASELGLAEDWGNTIEEFRPWFDIQYIHNLERMGVKNREGVLAAERVFQEYLTNRGYNLFPELDPILPKLAKAYRLAVLTNGPELRAKQQLKHRSSLFCEIVGNETLGEKSKPDPYGVSLCLERIGIKANEAVIVGDDPIDIIAGKEAGLRCKIGVSWGMAEKKDLLSAGADLVLEEIAQFAQFDEMFRDVV